MIISKNIYITRISVVGFALYGRLDFFPSAYHNRLDEVIHNLLPVGVFHVRGGGECDGLVQEGKGTFKETHKCMAIIIMSEF
jgi:hypothetical protein